MIAIDTNVLVRVLVDDPGQPSQVRAVRELVAAAAAVYVSLVVLVEAVWVLESAYRLDKPTILGVLTHLHTNCAFVLQDHEVVGAALAQFREAGAGFADCLILHQASRQGLALHTFDKRLARLTGAYPVK